jgi:hypothetical protein
VLVDLLFGVCEAFIMSVVACWLLETFLWSYCGVNDLFGFNFFGDDFVRIERLVLSLELIKTWRKNYKKLINKLNY